MVRVRLLALTLSGFVTLILAGSVLAANASVRITESNNRYSFGPAKVFVNAGHKVTWTNDSDAPHTVTSNSGTELASSNLNAGATFSHTFAATGTFAYHCSIHTYMKGTVVVLAAGAPRPRPTRSKPRAPDHGPPPSVRSASLRSLSAPSPLGSAFASDLAELPRAGPIDEKVGGRWALALDVDEPAGLEPKRPSQPLHDRVRHLHSPGHTERLHPAGQVHSVAPDVVDELFRADDASNDGAAVDTDSKADLEPDRGLDSADRLGQVESHRGDADRVVVGLGPSGRRRPYASPIVFTFSRP